ncbi:MAG: hypothetical protein U0P45_11325 [Acidimicrobiales bacterium]
MGAGSPEPTDLRRRRGRLVLAIAVVAVLLVAGGLAAWRATTPSAFPAYGNAWGYDGTIPVGQGYAVAMVDGVGGRAVTLEGARARVSDASASVAVDVLLCVPTEGREAGVGSVGLDELAPFCDRLLPVDGQDLAELPEQTSIVATFTPLANGPVVIRGIDLTYREGVRTVTQHTGTRVEYHPPRR